MKIKAAVLRQVQQPMVLEDVELQDPKDDEVLVRIMATGLCHSDYNVITGDMNIPLPIVLGHEGAGIVEAVGHENTRVSVGDHVALSWVPECGQCQYCASGRFNLCATSAPRVLDGTLLDGTTRLHDGDGEEISHYSFLSTFADMAVVPLTSCIPIDDDVPFVPASLVGCAVMTGIGAVMNNARVKPGSTVAVYGMGGVGLNVIQGAAVCGAGQIIAIDVNPAKAAIAQLFGATNFIDASETNVPEAINELTSGWRADYTFEAVGRPQTMAEAFDITARGGILVCIGVPPDGSTLELPAVRLQKEEKTVCGSFYGGSHPQVDFNTILRLYKQGRVKLDELVSETLPLYQINDGFKKLEGNGAIRTVAIPNEGF
jgi:S-(hydroxymethyl)glutathione dehydrogenase/alcohol dehydrogenase